MSVNEVYNSGLIDASRNTNLMFSEDEEALLEAYSDSLEQTHDQYSEFIQDIEKRAQQHTGTLNNCTVENDVYAEAMVFLHRFKEGEYIDESISPKVLETANELVEEGYAEKAAQLGQQIDDMYDLKEGMDLENDTFKEYREEEDAVIL